MRAWLCLVTVLCGITSAAQANPAENDAAMLRMATDRGCMVCHTILPAAKRSDGLPPIAPAWRDIAIKYRDDPTAYLRLTRTVMTGSDPRASHWAGRAGAVSMPPNASTVTEEEARVLVDWILVLVP